MSVNSPTNSSFLEGGKGVDYLIQASHWAKIEQRQQQQKLVRVQQPTVAASQPFAATSDDHVAAFESPQKKKGPPLTTTMTVAAYNGGDDEAGSKECMIMNDNGDGDYNNIASFKYNNGDENNISELFELVQELYEKEELLQAARLLRQVQQPKEVQNEMLFTSLHYKILHNAAIIEQAVQDFLKSPEDEDEDEDDHNIQDNDNYGGNNSWIKQGESHVGNYDTSIYYKIEHGSCAAKLTCRIETPIPTELLVPLLAVLNESSLYKEWIPSWSTPMKLGIQECTQLINDTRGHQIMHIKCDVPWPFQSREVILDALAVDDIEINNCIIVKMRSNIVNSPPEDLPEGFSLPPTSSKYERVEFDGSMLFRPCPKTHPNYKNAAEKLKKSPSRRQQRRRRQRPRRSSKINYAVPEELVVVDNKDDDDEEHDNDDDEDLILVQFMMYFDAHIDYVPTSVINFVTRTVIGTIWNKLLNVAEDVRDGKRTNHCNLIQSKPELYNWIKQRTQIMFENSHINNMKNDGRHTTRSCQSNDSTEEENHKKKAAAAVLLPADDDSSIQSNIIIIINNNNKNVSSDENWTLADAMKLTS